MIGWYITGMLINGEELEVQAVIRERDETLAVNKFVWKMEELWKCSVQVLSTTIVPIY